MKTTNRVCPICGKHYAYCPTCKNTEPQWRRLTDTQECLNLFNALSNFNFSGSDDDAKAVVRAVGGVNWSTYPTKVRNYIRQAQEKVSGGKKKETSD